MDEHETRKVVASGGQTYIVLPYTGFRLLGVAEEVPQVAVPLHDTIDSALVEPMRLSNEYEEALTADDVIRAFGLIQREKDGIAAGSARPEFEEKLAQPILMFRGESHEINGLMPTMFRISGSDFHKVWRRRRRLERRRARVIQAAMFLQKGVLIGHDASRAAVRHFGGPSAFLDFSFDPKVAAYFGHPALSESAKAQTSATAIGILYMLSLDRLAAHFETQGFNPLPSGGQEISFYKVQRGWRLPYLGYHAERQTIEPMSVDIVLPDGVGARLVLRVIPVPSVARIRRQQGLFIEIRGDDQQSVMAQILWWYLLDFLCGKWCYRRGNDAYMDPAAAITSADLLPDEGAILRLAERYISNWSR